MTQTEEWYSERRMAGNPPVRFHEEAVPGRLWAFAPLTPSGRVSPFY
jgi:hypothetical protein